MYNLTRSLQKRCKIGSENDPINDQIILQAVAKKLKCKFVISKVEKVIEKEEENLDIVHDPPLVEDLVPRPPVVAIVGHIDHGKTTLLDRLRKANVVESEFGRITQHIGAFSVSLKDYVKDDIDTVDKVTFLDTPGHAAFKNMRVRGAFVTDIVILMVDAVEGPLEQTLESIQAVKRARVSMIVAINKIDKPGADIERTKKALYDAGVQLEDFGGDVQAVPISALHGDGVEDLIEAVLAQSEVLQLSADPKGPVEGTIIESNMEVGLGKTATVLIKRGTLKKGQILVCGETLAKVKQLLDTREPLGDSFGSRTEIKAVKPAEACRIVGWKSFPHAGEEIMEAPNEKRAQQVIDWRVGQRKKEELQEVTEAIIEKRRSDKEVYDEFRMKKLKDGHFRRAVFKSNNSEAYEILKSREEAGLNDSKVSIVVRTDVDGSLEAILNCLNTYDEEEVKLDIVSSSVGAITETDLKLAQDFDGIVYAFNVNVPDAIRKAASSIYNVQIREHQVIYALIDDLKEEISQKLPLESVEEVIGRGTVAKEFLISENRSDIPVAGCRVNQGQFESDKDYRVLRGKEVIFEGSLTSLKHLKDEVTKVPQGKDCGLRVSDESIRFLPGDQILCLEFKLEKRQTSWYPGF